MEERKTVTTGVRFMLMSCSRRSRTKWRNPWTSVYEQKGLRTRIQRPDTRVRTKTWVLEDCVEGAVQNDQWSNDWESSKGYQVQCSRNKTLKPKRQSWSGWKDRSQNQLFKDEMRTLLSNMTYWSPGVQLYTITWHDPQKGTESWPGSINPRTMGRNLY